MKEISTEKLVKYSNTLLARFWRTSIVPNISNNDYEGEIKDQASVLKIGALRGPGWQAYTGTITYPKLNEIVAEFKTDQKKVHSFAIDDIDTFESFINDPKSSVIEERAEEFKELLESFLLGFWPDAAAGNWFGTDYVTGTVAVADDTGVVTGSGTTFTAGMVGKPFKAAGHTKWYRVKSYASATSITIENDSDDEASAYDGGTISAGATYVIQANSAFAIDNTAGKTFLTMVDALKLKLDKAKVPQSNRFLVIPFEAESRLRNDPGVKLNVPQAYSDLVEKGLITVLEGFKVFSSPYVAGDNATGWHVIAGHTSWLTQAMGLVSGPESMRLESSPATGYREIRVFGAKVADVRRLCAAHALVTF